MDAEVQTDGRDAWVHVCRSCGLVQNSTWATYHGQGEPCSNRQTDPYRRTYLYEETKFCNLCGYEARSPTDQMIHKMKKHGGYEVVICNVCNLPYANRGCLYFHTMDAHGGVKHE